MYTNRISPALVASQRPPRLPGQDTRAWGYLRTWLHNDHRGGVTVHYPPGPLPSFAIADDDRARSTLAAALKRDRKRLYARYDAGEFDEEAEQLRAKHPTLTDKAVRREVINEKLMRRWPPF